MSEIVLRPATPDDAETLSALIAASYATLRDGAYDPASIDAALPAMSHANSKLLASGTYYVAEIDGRAAGCGGWSFEAPGSGDREDGIAHIRHFAAHPDFRRQGVAHRLLDHCLAEAARSGAKVMRSQATLPAEPFYAKAGFRRVRTVEVQIGPATIPAIDMERALP